SHAEPYPPVARPAVAYRRYARTDRGRVRAGRVFWLFPVSRPAYAPRHPFRVPAEPESRLCSPRRLFAPAVVSGSLLRRGDDGRRADYGGSPAARASDAAPGNLRAIAVSRRVLAPVGRGAQAPWVVLYGGVDDRCDLAVGGVLPCGARLHCQPPSAARHSAASPS